MPDARFDILAAHIEQRLAGAESAMAGILALPGNASGPDVDHPPCTVCGGTGGYAPPNDGNGCVACAGTGWADGQERQSRETE